MCLVLKVEMPTMSGTPFRLGIGKTVFSFSIDRQAFISHLLFVCCLSYLFSKTYKKNITVMKVTETCNLKIIK